MDNSEPFDCFAVTLGLAERCPPASRWVSTPLGLGLHALAIAALFATWLAAPQELVRPRARALVVNLAAPPPPSPLNGASVESSVSTSPEVAVSQASLRPLPRIPIEILTPTFELPGIYDGFLDGSPDGLSGGVPEGVLGGVPGGIVGGVVGGTGGEIPRFPEPDVGPSPIRMPQPTYTRQAIRDNVSGAVVLRVVIDERGDVRVLKVLRSVPELDEEAIRVVESSWRFHPATKNGRPVKVLSDLVVRFNLY
jgi:protein TonB